MRLLKPRKQRSTRPLFSVRRSTRLIIITLSLSQARTLEVKLRKFRLNQQSSSERAGQLIINIPITAYRQVALRLIRKNKNPARAQSKRLTYANLLIIIGLSGLIASGLVLTGYQDKPSLNVVSASHSPASGTPETPASAEEQQYLGRSKPTRVRINSVGIDADIKTVGLNGDGALETPGVFEDKVGWYKHGPAPGQQGPAILVGHVDNYLGASVFWGLSQTKPGQKVIIEREDGETLRYSITKLVSYDQDSFLTDEVYGDINHAGLRLITCGGDFNPFSGDYSHNTVVYAKLESLVRRN